VQLAARFTTTGDSSFYQHLTAITMRIARIIRCGRLVMCGGLYDRYVKQKGDIMELKSYFASSNGLVILSTSDNNGNVDSTVYSSPRFFEDGRIGLIMRERLSYANVSVNPHVCLLFIEHGKGYEGKRLYLKKVDETDDKELIGSLLKRPVHGSDEGDDVIRHLVYFELIKERPLVGDGS